MNNLATISILVILHLVPKPPAIPVKAKKVPIPVAIVSPAYPPKTAPVISVYPPIIPQPPAFDVNNPTTWPTCPDTQLVWAQDGQCHDKVIPSIPTPSTNVSNMSPTGSTPATGCVTDYFTGDPAEDYIIKVESGGSSCATNPGGCFGLMQACPGSPLREACGGDPVCQLSWFATNKMSSYGSWQAVYAHEMAVGWW